MHYKLLIDYLSFPNLNLCCSAVPLKLLMQLYLNFTGYNQSEVWRNQVIAWISFTTFSKSVLFHLMFIIITLYISFSLSVFLSSTLWRFLPVALLQHWGLIWMNQLRMVLYIILEGSYILPFSFLSGSECTLFHWCVIGALAWVGRQEVSIFFRRSRDKLEETRKLYSVSVSILLVFCESFIREVTFHSI